MTDAIYIRLAEDEADNPVQWTVTYSGGDHTGDSSNQLDVEMVPAGEEMDALLVTNNDSVFHQVQIFYGTKHWINANLDPGDELLYIIPPDGTGWIFPSEPTTNIRNLEILIQDPTNGQVLTYSNGVWINADPTGGGGGGGSLPAFTGHAGDFLQVNSMETDSQWHTLTKSDVGLGNVNNTSDLAKPISTATQNALNLKQDLDGDLTAIGALSGTSGYLKKTAANTWTLDTSTFLTANQSITVTGDATGSGTTSIALTLATVATPGTYKSVTVNAKGLVTAGTNPTNALDDLSDVIITTPSTDQVLKYNGTDWVNATVPASASSLDDLTDVILTSPSTAQMLRYNGTDWVNATATKSDVGLGNVDNTSDVNKPVSTAQQTALNLKADLASPTFTGTVSGITKSMVGLGNVDNTSDANKPVSTATQTALNLKLDITTAASTYQPLDGDLTAIAALSTNGFAKRTGTNTWSIDTSTYLTSNQSITYTGDATGSGTTAVTLTLANSGVTASTYKSVTVDAKGRVTAGTNPTSLSGFGITAPLDDLSDVVITTPTTGQVVQYNGTNWVNAAPTSVDPKDVISYSFLTMGA